MKILSQGLGVKKTLEYSEYCRPEGIWGNKTSSILIMKRATQAHVA